MMIKGLTEHFRLTLKIQFHLAWLIWSGCCSTNTVSRSSFLYALFIKATRVTLLYFMLIGLCNAVLYIGMYWTIFFIFCYSTVCKLWPFYWSILDKKKKIMLNRFWGDKMNIVIIVKNIRPVYFITWKKNDYIHGKKNYSI